MKDRRLALVFEQEIRQLAAALEHQDADLREPARQTLRAFIDRIVIPSGDALLQVVGHLGEMLTADNGRTRSRLSVMGLAGACNRRYLRLWRLGRSEIVSTAGSSSR
jgi:hypothetical protein